MKSLLYGDHYTENGNIYYLLCLSRPAVCGIICVSVTMVLVKLVEYYQIPNWTCVHDESKYDLLTPHIHSLCFWDSGSHGAG